jgi:ribosomal protein S18 acetylase RimI-like enzyme
MKLKLVKRKGEPSPGYFKKLASGLLSHHEKSGHPRKSEKYSIFLEDENREVVGGVIVTFLWNGMEINSLWVDEKIRGQGWGKKLMEEVEEEGRKRSCTISYTNTFPWQAPGFYEKLGYELYGELKGLPEGASLKYFYKKLVD